MKHLPNVKNIWVYWADSCEKLGLIQQARRWYNDHIFVWYKSYNLGLQIRPNEIEALDKFQMFTEAHPFKEHV